ncbi:MAG: hypothetical protein JEZ08_04560 [Clostridiales bacterium]|nr:hypothetical protein [Clostridiales bacterium]
MKEFYDVVNEHDKDIYKEIEQFMISLGYKFKRAKTRDVNYLFKHEEVKKLILKYAIVDNKPMIKLKFYASDDYSAFFHEAIRKTIEEYDFNYTGCYKCGTCYKEPRGYTYHYDDNSYFRCGRELIELDMLDTSHLDELKKLLLAQHNFHLFKEL